ncbi:endonuclease SmrB [Arsukibacterium indicum]|uniref:Ribosome rescue factor SmrB n=1 Tax=Arsukibacterium indicum TaxID=2848612 RepID=A0ABS6MFT0_9GAMM|nr:endonuclease SmrB [Arsukibacterium indicum]MBV2127659.1 endonuclease SmrB [Arsukibacterium indicum]
MQRKKLSHQANLSAADSDLFRQSVSGARPLLQDKIAPVSVTSKKKARPSADLPANKQDLFFFSDGYEGFISDGSLLSYVQPGDDPRLAGRLKRAEYQPQVVLDLHGLTQLEAKYELAGLLAYCQQQQFNCACVVHGKGLGILARKVPNWLIQHPNVRAFHTAPKSWGKHGALLLLLKINQSEAELHR